MAETYSPLLYIDGYTADPTSLWHQTAWPTDTATVPGLNLGGWAQTALSTDTLATSAGRAAALLVQDEWA